MQLKNIMLNIVSDFVDQSLVLRNDICKCDQCRADIIAYVLSHLPPKYVTTDTGAVSAVIEQARVENEAEVIKQILKAIEKVSKKPNHDYKRGTEEDKEEAFRLLLEHIYTSRGIDFRRYFQKILKRRIARRMSANDVKTYSDYLRILISHPQEYEELFNILTINITEFFRDPTVFNAAKELLLNIVTNKIKHKGNSLKIWSAGCASGEEPYSIAIILKEIMEQKGSKLDIKIIATDIDKKSLTIAKFAEYEPKSLKNVNEHLLKKYFTPTNNGKYIVKDTVRESVKFFYHNVISDLPFENIDVVFCRNVFIFFNRSLQEHLVMTFYRSLKKEGYLIMGKVETFLGEATSLFKEINTDERIYQKI